MNDELMNTQPEIDATAIAASIASDFARTPQADPPASPPPSESGSNPESSATPPQPVDAGANSEPALAPISLPKSWKKEKEALWSGLPREVQEYFTEREGDFHKGINTYKQGHEQWGQLVEPFQSVLSQHPGVNPVQVMQNLMHAHLTLLSAPREKKGELAKKFLSFYGIEDAPAGSEQPPALPGEAEERLARMERALYEQKLAESQKSVESFFADKANKYASELEEDILNLIQKVPGLSLAQAYEQAKWLNPKVRDKLIAEQQAEAAEKVAKEAEKAAKARSLNVNGTPVPRSAAPRKGSIDDTINAVVAKHYGPQM